MHVSACQKGLTSPRANTGGGCICSCLEDSGERQQNSVPQVKRMHKCVGNGGKFVKTLCSWTVLWGRGPLFEFQ